MRRVLPSRTLTAAAAGVVTLIVAGGGYALASGGGTTIRACVKKGSRTIYKAPCKKGDKKISWSSTGPRGATGSAGSIGLTGHTGLTGPKGDPGATGPSNGYAATVPGPQHGFSGPINTLSLPAGSYVVTAAANLLDGADAYDDVHCVLRDPSGHVFSTGSGSTAGTTAFSQELTLTGVVVLASAGSIDEQCADNGNGNMQIYSANLTAVKVGSLTGSTG